MAFDVTRRNMVKTAIVIIMLLGAYLAGAFSTVPRAYQSGFSEGYREGYKRSLEDVNEYLKTHDVDVSFEWEDLGNGTYRISAYMHGTLYAEGNATIHLNILHYRQGILLSNETGAGVLTNIGKDWIEQQISGVSTTDRAIYCADSNDATDPPLATWTQLPSEITTNGLDRQTGSYASTGVGTWTVTCAKSVTGTQSTQLWGLHWIVTDNSNNNLLAADSGPAQKNCVSGDTLTETWSCSVTGA